MDEERIVLSRLELENIFKNDDDVLYLYHTNPLFGNCIELLSRGCSMTNIVEIIKQVCKNNDEIKKELIDIKMKNINPITIIQNK